jgi:DNA-directed RNA polymerase specialized sigma24 family protein
MRFAIQPSPAVPPSGESVEPECATNPDLFLHPLLDTPPARSKVTKAVWTEYRDLLRQARDACASCPLFVDCLYTAVAQVDVAGFVGCTTPRERKQIRSDLDVSVAPEDLDAAAGVRGERRPIDHEAVLAMRAAHPDESLEELASRLDCSLSTVKRHLRRARREASGEIEAERPAPKDPELPTVDDVLDAFDEIVETDRD